MGRERTSTTPERHSGTLRITTTGWSSRPVRLAISRRDRRLGVRPLAGPFDVLLRTGSIHTFGMHAPIGWVAFDRNGVVVGSGILGPRRVIVVWGATFVLEQPPGYSRPRPGQTSNGRPDS